MQRYIFFSKSFWSEPPRLRHQVANLVRSFGGDVLFFEKPAQFGRESRSGSIECIEPGLRVVRTAQLIHHQLRIASFLRAVNAAFEVREIRKVLREVDSEGAVIINFNYDYYFLREIFPRHKIISVINDDFVAQAKLLNGRHALKVLAKTSAMSDAVLVVSYPLADQVRPWCSPHLFFPWSDVDFKAPDTASNRQAVLIWAHIDRRLDFDLLAEASKLRPDIKFHIVGPVADGVRTRVEALRVSSPNFIFQDFGKLGELPLDSYFCSAIPYVKGVKDIEAVTLSNKTLQLLARGLPIVTHGMPSFYEHQAIVKSDSVEEFVAGLDFCREGFGELQPEIESLVAKNQAANRFEQLQRIIQG